jgi:hypothetical protein
VYPASAKRAYALRRLRRRFTLLLLLFFTLALTARDAGAADTSVPIVLQAGLLAKVAAYDRNFAARAGQRARVLVVERPKDADSARAVAQMRSALSEIPTIAGLPHDEIVIAWSSAKALADTIKAEHAAIVFFTPGFSDDLGAISTALAGIDVLSAAAVPEYVPGGVVLGFALIGGKPKLLANLTQASKQNVAFQAEVLKMMKVFP